MASLSFPQTHFEIDNALEQCGQAKTFTLNHRTACLRCRQKRQQCTMQHPSCYRCTWNGLDCQYPEQKYKVFNSSNASKVTKKRKTAKAPVILTQPKQSRQSSPIHDNRAPLDYFEGLNAFTSENLVGGFCAFVNQPGQEFRKSFFSLAGACEVLSDTAEDVPALSESAPSESSLSPRETHNDSPPETHLNDSSFSLLYNNDWPNKDISIMDDTNHFPIAPLRLLNKDFPIFDDINHYPMVSPIVSPGLLNVDPLDLSAIMASYVGPPPTLSELLRYEA